MGTGDADLVEEQDEARELEFEFVGEIWLVVALDGFFGTLVVCGTEGGEADVGGRVCGFLEGDLFLERVYRRPLGGSVGDLFLGDLFLGDLAMVATKDGVLFVVGMWKGCWREICWSVQKTGCEFGERWLGAGDLEREMLLEGRGLFGWCGGIAVGLTSASLPLVGLATSPPRVRCLPPHCGCSAVILDWLDAGL